jgi:DNA-binding Xre family transcriptional regulator
MPVRSNLKEILDERGLSIRQVARDINYRFESIRQMYNNETDRFNRELLTKLCDYLQVDIGDLIKLDN